MAILEVIPAATLVVAVAAVTRTVWETVGGLLAKRAAQRVIARRTESDEQLRNLVKQFSERPADTDVEAAAKTITESLKAELSKTELRRIGQGLNQSNKSGERRYIEDLMSDATSKIL